MCSSEESSAHGSLMSSRWRRYIDTSVFGVPHFSLVLGEVGTFEREK